MRLFSGLFGANLFIAGLFLAALPLAAEGAESEDKPLVIAHRGAPGYLPEHTLEGQAMAYAQGADFIEQDVVLSRDGVPLVLHDLYLDAVTDVAEVFPDRARADGRFYAIDFTAAEIQALRVSSRIDLDTGGPAFPGRFPLGLGDFRVPTLDQSIELVQGLNASTGREVGIYTEIKAPAWHAEEGQDLARIVVETLADYGYEEPEDPVFLQSFEWPATQRLRGELGYDGRLIQLIGENRWNLAPNTDFDHLKSPEGLAEIAGVADGIGPWFGQIVEGRAGDGGLVTTALLEDAHGEGLAVHPYTFRADRVPDFAPSFEALVEMFLFDLGVDGIFTDHTDRALAVRDGGRG